MERAERIDVSHPPDERRKRSSRDIRWESRARMLLALAGIDVGGHRPWDIQVHRDRFFRRAVTGGSLGLGESYMDGDWECAQLDECITRMIRADLASRVPISLAAMMNQLRSALVNRWSRSAVRRKVAPHYDLGNDLFIRMLDDRYMAYT